MEKNLKLQLEEILKNDYRQNVTPWNYDMFKPKIERFIDFVSTNDRFKDKKPENLITVLTSLDIVEATVYNINKLKLSKERVSETAINDCLKALGSFLSIGLKIDKNITLKLELPFTKLNQIVKEELKKEKVELEKSIPKPEITEEQFNYIVNYLEKNISDNYYDYLHVIIIKLCLFYGLKYKTLCKLKKDDYCKKSGSLYIKENKPYSNIKLKLNEVTQKDINDYLDRRKEYHDNNLLVINHDKAIGIKSDYGKGKLRIIKNEYMQENNLSDVSLSINGLCKFAIIKMLHKGINVNYIKEMTGATFKFIYECQQRHDELFSITQEKKNETINKQLKSIK